MRRKEELPELLAPAGSFAAMLAAVEAGADAVYLAGKSFGARAFAANFDEEELARAIRYCHLHGVKVYVTVNTLVLDREADGAIAFCRTLSDMGADAVITADTGLVRRLRREVPDLPVHASTQMSVHNAAGVRAAAEAGAERVVLARELSLSDIKAAVDRSPVGIEVFLHGALCVCHSGQCLFSSLVGGRSGNRGECAGPCRLPYNGQNKYPLSLCDLSLAQHVRELIDAGVESLKIEGRMKSPDYVYGVTRVYRRLLDERRDAKREENAELSRLFSRGGFTDGYFTGKHRAPMTGVRTEEDKANTRAGGEREFLPMRVPVRAEAHFRLGEACSMTVTDGKRSVTVMGGVPREAQSAPLNKDDLSTRLCKMGNTFLSLDKKDLLLEVDEGINLSPSEINALRRAAAEAFENTGRKPSEERPVTPAAAAEYGALRSAVFYRPEVLAERPSLADSFDRVFVPLFAFAGGPANGVYLPPVVMDGEWDKVRAEAEKAARAGAKYALLGNLSHVELIKGTGLIPMADFRFNITNRQAAAYVSSLGVTERILSPELTLPRMRDIGGGAIVYGRIPLMLTERCFVRENGGCEKCGRFAFTDRRGKRFPVLREYEHRNLILNSVPTYMGDRQDDLTRAGILHQHFLFTTESAGEIAKIISDYDAGITPAFEVRRIKA